MMKFIAAFMLSAFALCAADTADVTGAWMLSIKGDHAMSVNMELKQEASKVAGTLKMPQGGDVELKGNFDGGQLILAGAHDMPDGKQVTLKFTARLNEDGTLTGDLNSDHGNMTWSAERIGKSAK